MAEKKTREERAVALDGQEQDHQMRISRSINRFAAAALLVAALPLTALAGPQADQAVAAVRLLMAQGEIKPGDVLRLRAKQGNTTSMLGRDFQLQREWEHLTGTLIDASLMPQLDSLAFIRDNRDVDLTLARTHEFADLDAQGLIEDLTPLLKRLGMQLDDNLKTGYILPQPQTMVGSKIVAVPADLDLALLFMRRDLLEDPAQRERFKKLTGEELRPPRTWDDYQRLVEFFGRPQEGFYGAAEPRERLTGWMYWLPRYLSAAAPNQYLFDDQMRPLINSAAGVAATASYLATLPQSPPDALGAGNDYSYTLPFFLRGHAFSTILTVATAKIANRSESAVKGKVMAAPMPGHQLKGGLHRRTPFIYGNNFVIPRTSEKKALALLFAMWLTDPDNSVRSVTANGIADPYRYNHFDNDQVRALYTPQALEVMRSELGIAAPAGTGLPGDSEYLAALSENLWLAASGKQTAQQAMAKTAKAWNAITDRLGRARQVALWRAAKTQFPSTAPTTP